TILQARGAVVGLTTAATIWAVAGVGIAIGAGATALAVLATVVIVACLTLLRWIERWNLGRKGLVTLAVCCRDEASVRALLDLISSRPFVVESSSVRKSEQGVELTVSGTATASAVDEILAALAASESVTSADVHR
ncbi:MAG: hypothetical protein D6815_12595, partial [Candidatus Dadabacteria bacterium]